VLPAVRTNFNHPATRPPYGLVVAQRKSGFRRSLRQYKQPISLNDQKSLIHNQLKIPACTICAAIVKWPGGFRLDLSQMFTSRKAKPVPRSRLKASAFSMPSVAKKYALCLLPCALCLLLYPHQALYVLKYSRYLSEKSISSSTQSGR